MRYVEFDVEKLGHFKAQETMTIEQDLTLDVKVNDFLGGQMYEMEARADALASSNNETSKKAALGIRTQINTIRLMFLLEAVIVEAPEGYKNIRSISDYGIFFKIWEAYSQKKSELTSVAKKS